MHIVLSGYYGFDNVGDEAILLSIIHALKKWQPDVKITVLSNNPPATEKTYGVQAINRWKMKEVRTVLKQADGLISGGGSLMQDQTGMKSIPYYAGIIKIAQWLKKPVFIYTQGMGPIHKGINKFIVKNAFNKAAAITVRDEASKVLLEEIGVTKSVSIVPDPVIGLESSNFDCEWLKKQTFKDTFITVSVRDWPSSVAFKEKIADSLDRLVRNGQHVIFVPMHGEHDAKSSAEVAAMMQEKSTIAPADLSIEEKIAVIGQSDLLIGMRLHSLIFSAIQYTPFIALSYDPKIDAFANIAKQPIVGHVEVDNWDGEMLYNKASEMLNHHDLLVKEMKQTIQTLQNDATTTAKLALQKFEK